MTDRDADVLIVGAGPTGLTLACTLAQRGVGVRIIDAASAPPTGSRGKGLQPRSLELFDDLGILCAVLAHGSFGLPIRYYDESGQFKDDQLYQQRSARPDAPFVNPLLTPQWRVEAALRQELERLGRQVEFGVEVCGVTQDDAFVTAQLAGPAASSIRVPWLIGCDGGRSLVRQAAGIAFLGETLEQYRMLVGDVRLEGLDRDHWHIWRSAEGFLALCPLPSTDQFQLQASIAPGQENEASLAVFQSLVDRRSAHSGARLTEASWLSLWRANVRMVDRYREGRVFLAGDAAHVHSPAGGQGMNTGIQDAYNLGWKLAAVLRGTDARLLDTYQEERLPIAAWVLGISNQIMASTVASGTIAFRRDEQTTQLGLGYRNSSLTNDMRATAPAVRAGERAPDAPGLIGPDGPCRLFDLLRGPHATVLAFGARWQGIIDACRSSFARSVQAYVIVGGFGNADHYRDAQGHACSAYGDQSLFVVRPDNYIGFAIDEVVPAAVMAYLERICPPRQTRVG